MILVDGSLAADIIPEPEIKTETVKQEAYKPAEAAPEVKAEPAPTPVPVPEKNNGIRGVGVPEGRKIVIGGHYKHFKGGEYVVLNVAKDHETCEEQAVYMQIHDKPIIWIRPLNMFLEDVDDHGNIKPRFSLIQD
ncbi:MAG: DUF1653 domain-containing protein [Oscillospiraceae bacterium]|nr:DUF1653 domain-containing protein [Oscillospiraceae bacterium]